MSSAPPHHHHRPSPSCRWTLRPFCNTQPAGASPLRPPPALPALCTEYARDCDNSSRETCDVDPLAGTIITWKEAVRHSRNCANSFPIGTEPASILEQGYLGTAVLYFPNEATSLRTRLPWSRRPGSTHESLLFSPYHSTRQHIHTHTYTQFCYTLVRPGILPWSRPPRGYHQIEEGQRVRVRPPWPSTPTPTMPPNCRMPCDR